MTIHNHQLLKDALILTLNDYDNLSKDWYRFFSASGDAGKARAAFIRIQLDDLKNLHDVNQQKKIEILFCAIIKSDIFSSIVERLKKLLLKHILPDISDYDVSGRSINRYIGMSSLYVDSEHRSLMQKLSQNTFFNNIGKSIHYCEGYQEPDYETHNGYFWSRLKFSRTDALKSVSDTIYALEKHQVDHLVKRINNYKNQSDLSGSHVNFEMAQK